MNILAILGSLGSVYLMLIPGIIFGRKNIIYEDQIIGVCYIILYITWPCMVINSLQIDFSVDVLINGGKTILVAISVLAIAYLISKAAAKLAHIEGGRPYLFAYMLTFANTGFMGLPIIRSIYSGEALFYAATYDTSEDIFIFTVGILLIQLAAGDTEKKKISFRRVLSPGLFALLLGVLLFLFRITLPPVIKNTVSNIGSCTSMLAMFYLGYRLGKMKLKTLLGDKDAYFLCFLKLIVIPMLMFGFIKLCIPEPSIMWQPILVQVAMPPAANAVIMSTQYKSDVDFASKGVLLATTLSVLTIPIFAVLASTL